MTLREAIEKSKEDFLYIGAENGFIWIGKKEDCISGISKLSDYYQNEYYPEAIKRAK